MENYEILFLLFLFFINFLIFFNFDLLQKIIPIFDFPDQILKNHKVKTSLLGGLLFLVNLFVIYFFYKLFSSNFVNDKFLIFASIFFLIGLIDDIKNLKYSYKFLIIISVLVCYFFFFPEQQIKYLKFDFIKHDYYLKNYSFLFSVLSFLLFINAANLFDGINLQAGLYFFVFIVFLFLYSQIINFIFFLVPIFYFLILNNKNKIFLGNSGVLLLSFLVAHYTVETYHKNFLYVDDIVILMFLPGIDMLRLFLYRIYLKKNPFKGDRNHIHHLLVDKFNYKNTVFLVFLFVFIPSFLKFFFQINPSYLLILCIVFYFYLLILFKFRTKL
jgi:UDP-GlcNAc:undecaprenyl-phosphate GlcNAc-1-phosphate transferase